MHLVSCQSPFLSLFPTIQLFANQIICIPITGLNVGQITSRLNHFFQLLNLVLGCFFSVGVVGITALQFKHSACDCLEILIEKKDNCLYATDFCCFSSLLNQSSERAEKPYCNCTVYFSSAKWTGCLESQIYMKT